MRGILLLITILSLLVIVSCGSEENLESGIVTESVQEDTHSGESLDTSVSETNSETQTDLQETVTFILNGENFKFIMDGNDNPEMKVKQGDVVRVEFSSTGGFHDWVIDEFNARTKRVRPEDGNTFVEFVADKNGTFEYYCSVGSHRVSGMKGNFIVE